jgi:hypothetical protein
MTSTNVPMVSKAMFNALRNNPPVLAYRFLATIYDAHNITEALLSAPGHRSHEAFVGLRGPGGHRGAYDRHVARRLKHDRGHRL